MRDTLHWLPIQQRIQFKILTLMRNCLVGSAPSYLRDFCISVSSVPGRGTLRSAAHGLLTVPRMHTATAQSRSFAYVGPTSWNRLSRELRLELLSLSLPQFRKRLKSVLLTVISLVRVGSATDEFILEVALYKCQITITNYITLSYFL